jgi:acyl dehydratase
MNNKPVVKYQAVLSTPPKVGTKYFIRPINHPSPFVSNTTIALTSTVLTSDDKTWNFETNNTIYVLDDIKNSHPHPTTQGE